MSMSWEKLAQNRIEEAIAAGEFDDLPGKGKPLDLAEYFALSPTERAGEAVLKNAGVLPPEMELLRKIAALEAALASADRADERGRLQAELQEQRVVFALAMELRKKRESN
jgi:hypothetical protein